MVNVKHIWNTVNELPAFSHSNTASSAPLFIHPHVLGMKCRHPIGSSSCLPFKTHMHFHLSGFMVVDLPGSGNECLPADENYLLVHEVEALQQEGKP